MNIAIDISPLETGHKVRGVGFYLKHLRDALTKYFPDNDYTFFTDTKTVPQNIQVLHYPYFDPFFPTLPVKKVSKTIVTVHDLTPLVFPHAFPVGLKGRLHWQRQKFALSRVDGVIADSEASRRDIVRLTNIDERKVHVVYLAAGEEFTQVSKARVEEIKKKYQLPESFVLYVGDVTWNKNVPSIIKAVQKLSVPLVLVGKTLADDMFDESHPWNADRVQVKQLTTGDKSIIRLGFIPDDDLVAIYNAATVFVFPSLYEGFGLPVLEAMSCGTPVVTTRCGSLPEVAGDAALFVDPENIENIAQGVNLLLKDRTLQKELSQKGLVHVKKFSWKKTAEATTEIYKSISST